MANNRVSYISAAVAAALDEELMHPDQGAFSLDQLMELAGLACAQAVFRSYPPDQCPTVLVACGPGNQGGDGLVAARHLLHFGYCPKVWYPKRGKAELFSRLVQQLVNLEVEFVDQEDFEDALETADVVLDAIFGFSFKGEVREPFREPLELLKDESRMEFEQRSKLPPIVSVDIPSAWDVNEGNLNNRSFTPQVLVSLTAPKLGARNFQGRHFLGGRFLPPAMAERYGILLPPVYTGGVALVGAGGSNFGLGTGSSSGAPGGESSGGNSGPNGSATTSAQSGSSSSRVQQAQAHAQPSSSSSSSAAPSSSLQQPPPQSSPQQYAQQSASSSSSSNYYAPRSPSTANFPAYDDSQIIEITGAEPVPLHEVTPSATAAGSSAPASASGAGEGEAEGEGASRIDVDDPGLEGDGEAPGSKS
ncbi:hypothetical protein OC835_003041 [Tilletia horrida]|nr:hypothetical protein OC835_003041 [Tilletia horrida]KAK0559272.1 hypothetical protein OC844_004529 [Tilletia horrida]